MKKTILATAVLLSLGTSAAQAVSIDITTMKFYDANGALPLTLVVQVQVPLIPVLPHSLARPGLQLRPHGLSLQLQPASGQVLQLLVLTIITLL